MMNQLDRRSRTLCFLSFTALFERYSYYSVQCTLVLLLINFFFFKKAQAYDLFGAFTAMAYLMTPVGGYCSDRWLTPQIATLFGAVLLLLGYSCLSFSVVCLYIGLAIVAVGNGFFQPNIALLVGGLFEDSNKNRDAAFMLFYAAINAGAVLPPLIAAWLLNRGDWQMIYLICAVLVCISIFIFRQVFLCQPDISKNVKKIALKYYLYAILLSLFSVFIVFYVLHFSRDANLILLIMTLGFFIGAVVKGAALSGHEKLNFMFCCLLTLFSIFFWALYQQTAMSILFFSKDYIHRSLLGYRIPSETYMTLNPLFIILLTPLLTKVWYQLSKKNIKVNVSVKFSLAIILMGFSFLLFPIASYLQGGYDKMSMLWLIIMYALQALAELCISPIGMSMISSYAPKSLQGMMMGFWYLASAAAFALSGFISDWTLPSVTNHLVMARSSYTHVFLSLGLVAFIFGFVLWCFAPRLQFHELDPLNAP